MHWVAPQKVTYGGRNTCLANSRPDHCYTVLYLKPSLDPALPTLENVFRQHMKAHFALKRASDIPSIKVSAINLNRNSSNGESGLLRK
jgi:hypothetical protein